MKLAGGRSETMFGCLTLKSGTFSVPLELHSVECTFLTICRAPSEKGIDF